jgi:hypothetical protein
MWPLKGSPTDPPHQQPGSAQPPRQQASVRWRRIALVSLGLLLLVALVGGWAYLTFWADTAEYEGVVWKRQEDNWIITVTFTRFFIVGNREVTFKKRLGTLPEGEGPSASDSATYRVLDAKTLEMGTPPGKPPEKLTIDSITSQKLVLSGGPWKFDKTEFTKQK